MDASYVAGIAYQLTVFALVGFACGDSILRWAGLLPGRSWEVGPDGGFRMTWVGITERILAAYVGFVAFAVAMMALQIVSRGLVFSTPGVLPAFALAVVVWWWRGRDPMPRPRPVSYLKLAGLLVVLLAIFALPAFRAGSSVRTGDPPWHLGWTEQLLAGEPVPVGPAPEFARNAYPWGLHGTMATLVRLAPGTDPLTSLETLHLLLVAGLPLAAACLAFRLRRDSGWAAAASVALIGGFGWIVSGGADFGTTPRAARAGADMVVASPNSVYGLFPPALPRELGVVLLGAAGLFTLIGARNRLRRVELLAGYTAGLAGLVSVPMFVSSLVWMAVAGLAVSSDRKRFLRHTVLGAGLVFSLWALPVLIDYVRLGGFVDITPRLGMEWPLHMALSAWGVLLPLAVGGAWLASRRREVEDRVMLLFLAGTVAVLLLSILRGAFDWDVWGNATLLHQGRVWPPLHLLGAAFAGPGLMWLYERISFKPLATVAVLAILGVGSVSVVLSSMHLTELMERGAAGFVHGGRDVQDEDSFLRRAAAHLGPDDIVAVEGDDPEATALAFQLFEFSGVRLADYDHPNLPANDLRIRFAEPARRWQESRPFVPHYEVIRSRGSVSGPSLARGVYRGQSWELVPHQR